jgi:hypothetical protein
MKPRESPEGKPSMLTTNTTPRSAQGSAESIELRGRMQRPQRHRLLHGYPLASAIPRVAEQTRRDATPLRFDPGPRSADAGCVNLKGFAHGRVILTKGKEASYPKATPRGVRLHP